MTVENYDNSCVMLILVTMMMTTTNSLSLRWMENGDDFWT